MNEMRKLMEAIKSINEADNHNPLRSDPDNPPTPQETDKYSGKEVHSSEAVTVIIGDDVELRFHGRPVESVYLDKREWTSFVDMITGQGLQYVGEDVHPSEDHWPHDKPYPKTPPVSPDLANADVENFIEKAAMALAKDAIVQSAGVYDEEGPGEGRFATGAKSRDEYVRIAAHRFLDKDYKKAILVNFQQQFNEYVDYWLDET